MSDIVLSPKTPISRELLLIDGVGRSGKMLMAKLVSNFKRVDYFQVLLAIDHVPVLSHLGVMSEDNAAAYLRLAVDGCVYDRACGRGMNLRPSDYSCVAKATDYPDLIRRTVDPEGPAAIAKFNTTGRIPAFLSHHIIPHARLFFKMEPNTRIIEVSRHPMDVASSWYHRGWAERMDSDPMASVPRVQTPHGDVPWWARDYADQYYAMSPVDRLMKTVIVLTRLCNEGRAALTAEQRARTHLICYEHLFDDPEGHVNRAAAFIGTEPYANMKAVLAREGLPATLDLNDRRAKRAQLAAMVSPSLMEELAVLCADYERSWGLEPLS
ncbi:MAG: sulfotransferase domain-containing protein [Rhodospirillaceae bacterium]|nr:sulfotransferase domain-containing protein [Rhodospirillales bacterium]